ncbi:Oidioi.mRNA.OKI2018_I69.chr1.g1249.t1.cds [Oikopleura dioica]|uniref:Oidioi.mRNA.OKI2018_I69.chr1.g1249.t1.cds n=1 Tax=Oikopleura dioica TaxID=34765 RepID=A0ABN7SMC0_OIKDI|nr:Oidioi.mRNA.OKI2018_I69.chr1.g1249.t1.cds [Oikopleura dioica]
MAFRLTRNSSNRKIRKPEEVECIGVQKRLKEYFFIFSVRWNDESKLTIFRSWHETHDLAKQIKNETVSKSEPFEVAKELEKIVKPPGCLNFAKRSAYDVCEKLQEILTPKFPINLFHSSFALDFFHLTPEDRNSAAYRNFTSFHIVKESSQKSIKIRPATMMATKTYNVRESYKCSDDSAGEVEIHTGEKIRVLIKKREEEGWVPASHIEFSNNTKSMKKLQKSTNETYLMIESHKAENDEELSVPANATVQVTHTYANGWWKVLYLEEEGLVPRAKMQKYEAQNRADFINSQ